MFPSQQILILRPLKWDEMVLTLNVLKCVRDQYPDSRLTLATLPDTFLVHATLTDFVDEVVAFPIEKGLETEKFLSSMRAKKFDLVLALHDDLDHLSELITRLEIPECITSLQGSRSYLMDVVVAAQAQLQ